VVFGGKILGIETTWNIKMDLQAHTDHSHDSRKIKWKKLTTEQPNGL